MRKPLEDAVRDIARFEAGEIDDVLLADRLRQHVEAATEKALSAVNALRALDGEEPLTMDQVAEAGEALLARRDPFPWEM